MTKTTVAHSSVVVPKNAVAPPLVVPNTPLVLPKTVEDKKSFLDVNQTVADKLKSSISGSDFDFSFSKNVDGSTVIKVKTDQNLYSIALEGSIKRAFEKKAITYIKPTIADVVHIKTSFAETEGNVQVEVFNDPRIYALAMKIAMDSEYSVCIKSLK
jgi:hypothetical protein